MKLARKLGVEDRLDLRPLDFNALSYRHRLEGCHVLLGNSRKEGFLLTAAEALSCAIPVVVTKTCGIAESPSSQLFILSNKMNLMIL